MAAELRCLSLLSLVNRRLALRTRAAVFGKLAGTNIHGNDNVRGATNHCCSSSVFSVRRAWEVFGRGAWIAEKGGAIILGCGHTVSTWKELRRCLAGLLLWNGTVRCTRDTVEAPTAPNPQIWPENGLKLLEKQPKLGKPGIFPATKSCLRPINASPV